MTSSNQIGLIIKRLTEICLVAGVSQKVNNIESASSKSFTAQSNAGYLLSVGLPFFENVIEFQNRPIPFKSSNCKFITFGTRSSYFLFPDTFVTKMCDKWIVREKNDIFFVISRSSFYFHRINAFVNAQSSFKLIFYLKLLSEIWSFRIAWFRER